jgi:hypothetical protein
MSGVGHQLFEAHRPHYTDITGNFQIGARVSARPHTERLLPTSTDVGP